VENTTFLTLNNNPLFQQCVAWMMASDCKRKTCPILPMISPWF